MTETKRVNKKPLKLKALEKQFKEDTKYHTHIIDPESQQCIKYKIKFPEKDVDALIEELYKHILEAEKAGVEALNNDLAIIDYAMYLIVKHFTHFKDEIGDDFATNVAAHNLLYQSGIYELCHEELFDQNEVFDVLDKINKISNKAIVDEKLTKDVREEVKELVENKEILSDNNG